MCFACAQDTKGNKEIKKGNSGRGVKGKKKRPMACPGVPNEFGAPPQCASRIVRNQMSKTTHMELLDVRVLCFLFFRNY